MGGGGRAGGWDKFRLWQWMTASMSDTSIAIWVSDTVSLGGEGTVDGYRQVIFLLVNGKYNALLAVDDCINLAEFGKYRTLYI